MNAGKWEYRFFIIFLAISSFSLIGAQNCTNVNMLELSIDGVFVDNGAVVDATGQSPSFISVAVTVDDMTLNEECDEDFNYLGFIWDDQTEESCKATFPFPLPVVSTHSVNITCTGNGTLNMNLPTSLEVTLFNLPEVIIQTGECTGDSIQLSVPVISDASRWRFSWTRAMTVSRTRIGNNSINVRIPPAGITDSWTVCLEYDVDPDAGEDFRAIKCSFPVVNLDGSAIRPTINLTPGPGEREICQSDELTLRIENPGDQTYEWVSRSNPNNVLATSSVVSLEPGGYTVRTTGPGCAASQDFDIVGISGPNPPTLTAGSETEACPGEMATVEVNAVTGLTYRWETRNGEELETGNTYSAASSTNFQVVAINPQNGCASVPTLVSIAQRPAHNPSITPSADPPYCEGQMVTLEANNLGNAMAMWSTGVMGVTIDVDAGGEYSVRFSGGTLCDNSDTITIAEFGEPTALPIQPDQSVFSGELASIPILLGGAVRVTLDSVTTMNATVTNVNISPSGVLSFLPEGAAGARATGAIRFTLIPESAEGCTGPAQTLLVRVVPDVEEPFIPEIISPNGDGSNDEWAVVFPEDGADYDVVVYSRGGAVVFEGSGSQMPWDAGPCPNGVYYYRITQRGPEGGQWQGALTIIGREGR